MRAALTGCLLGILVLGCAAQSVSPALAPSADASSRSPSPSSRPSLHVGGIATADRFIHLQTAVGAAPRPGQRDAGNLEAGSIAYLMDGPADHAGLEWWLVRSERSTDVGWTPSAQDGTPLLVPLDPDCPPIATVRVEQIVGVGGVRSLLCFGAAPLTFDANVFCVSGVADGGPGGASWMDSYRWCHTAGDPAMPLFGEAITSILGHDLAANPVTARMRINGHFDDPESSTCWNLPIGVSLDAPGPPNPSAVIACRERFVVTKAVRLD